MRGRVKSDRQAAHRGLSTQHDRAWVRQRPCARNGGSLPRRSISHASIERPVVVITTGSSELGKPEAAEDRTRRDRILNPDALASLDGERASEVDQ
jgi:hypothetical protein